MSSEELFEIHQRIGQIKLKLAKRKEKYSEWAVPYQRILEVAHSSILEKGSEVRLSVQVAHQQIQNIIDKEIVSWGGKRFYSTLGSRVKTKS